MLKYLKPYQNAKLKLLQTHINTQFTERLQIIEHPRVLTVRVKLTDIDLSGLDLTRPVYFDQFGRHYAILSVQAQTDGLCKCNLLAKFQNRLGDS